MPERKSEPQGVRPRGLWVGAPRVMACTATAAHLELSQHLQPVEPVVQLRSILKTEFLPSVFWKASISETTRTVLQQLLRQMQQLSAVRLQGHDMMTVTRMMPLGPLAI